MAEIEEIFPYETEEHGKNYRCITKIKCVSLSDINIPKPWAPSRTVRIMESDNEKIIDWLSSIVMEMTYGSSDCFNAYKLPRMVKIGKDKYEIQDGIHRTNVAKDLGMSCILALVDDCEEINA